MDVSNLFTIVQTLPDLGSKMFLDLHINIIIDILYVFDITFIRIRSSLFCFSTYK